MAEPSVDPKAAAAPLLVPIGAFAGNPPFKLTRPVILAGTEEHCHLHLISSTVSKHHMIMIVSPAVTYVRDLASRSGVFVNDHPVAEAVLKNGDRLMIGKFGFTYVGPTGKGKTEARTKPVTAVVDGDAMPGKVEGRVLMIGRRPGSDILLDAESVSLCHAVIFEFGGKRYLRDMDSRTGTFLQGKKIHQSEVKIGDRIRIGNSTLELRAYEVPPDKPMLEKPVLRASAVMEVLEDLEAGVGAGSTALPPHQPAPISQSTRPAPKARPAEPQPIADKVDLNKDLSPASADMAGETSAMESPFKAQGEEPKREEVKPSPKPVAAASAPAPPAAAPVKEEPTGTWPRRGWRSGVVEPAVPVVPAPPVAPVPPPPAAAAPAKAAAIDLVELEPPAAPQRRSAGDTVVEATHAAEKVAVVEAPARLPQEAAISLPPVPLVEEISLVGEAAEVAPELPAMEPEITATTTHADVIPADAIPVVEEAPESIVGTEHAGEETVFTGDEAEVAKVEVPPGPEPVIEVSAAETTAAPEPEVQDIAAAASVPEPEVIALTEEAAAELIAAPEPAAEVPVVEAIPDVKPIPLADTPVVETPPLPEPAAGAPKLAIETPVAESIPLADAAPVETTPIAAAPEPDVIPMADTPVETPPLPETVLVAVEPEIIAQAKAPMDTTPLPDSTDVGTAGVADVMADVTSSSVELAEGLVASASPEPEIISVVEAAAPEPVEVPGVSEWDVPPVEVATADLTASGDEPGMELPTELESGFPADLGAGTALVDEQLLDLGSFAEKAATLEIFPVKQEPTSVAMAEEFPVVEISAPPVEPSMERGLGISLEPEVVRPSVSVSSGFFQDGNGDGAGPVEEIAPPPEVQVTVDPAVISAAAPVVTATAATAAATLAATAAAAMTAATMEEEEEEEDVRPRKGKGKAKAARGKVKRIPPRPAEPPAVEAQRPEVPPAAETSVAELVVESAMESVGESGGESVTESVSSPLADAVVKTTVTASDQDAAPFVPTLNLSGMTAPTEPEAANEILGGEELGLPHHVEGEIFEMQAGEAAGEPAAETLEAEAEPRIVGLDLREADFSAMDFGEAGQAVHIPDAPAVTHEAEAEAVVERVIEPPVHENPEVQDPQTPPEKTLDLDAALPAVESVARAAEPAETVERAAAEGSLGEIEQSFVEASTGPLVVTENPVELDHLPWGRDEMQTGTEHAMELGPPLEPVVEAPGEPAEILAEPAGEMPGVVATVGAELPVEAAAEETGTEQSAAMEPVEIVDFGELSRAATAPQSPVVAEPLEADVAQTPVESPPTKQSAVEPPAAAAMQSPVETPIQPPIQVAAAVIPPPPVEPPSIQPPPVQPSPPPAQLPKPTPQTTWMGGVNLVQFFGGMPVKLNDLPPAPKGYGKVNLDFGDAIKPRNAEGVPEIPPMPVEHSGEVPTLVGTPPEPPPIEPVGPPPSAPGVPLPPPPPPARATPTLVPWPFAGDIDELPPGASGKTRQAPPTPGRAPRKEAGGSGVMAPGPFDGLAMPSVRQKDVFSDLEVTPLNDAAFGGARLTREDDYIVPDSPETAARKSEEPDRDFAADDFWNRTDDEESPAGGQVSEEERKSLSEEDEGAGITATTDLATVFPVVSPVTASRRIQPVSPRRPPVMVGENVEDSPGLARRYRRRLLGIALGGFVSVAVCVAGIMHFVPKASMVTGTLHVQNFDWVAGSPSGNDFESNQRHLLARNALPFALKHLRAEHPQISGGFLDSPDGYARVAGSMMLDPTTLSDGSHETTIQLTVEGTDPAADTARMTALLEAMVDVNGDKTAQNRQTLNDEAQAEKDVQKYQADMDRLIAKIADAKEITDRKPADDEVTAANDKLAQQWQSRAAAMRSVGTDLDKMSDDSEKMPPPLGQTASWGLPAAGLNSDRSAAAKDLDSSLGAPDAGAVAALGQLTDAIGTFNAATDKVAGTADATGSLAATPRTMLNVLLANGARLQTQITQTRLDAAEDLAAQQRALWGRDPQVSAARASLNSAWHDLGAMITKGQATPAAVDAQQRQIAQLTDSLSAIQSLHPVDPRTALPDAATTKVLQLRQADLSVEKGIVEAALMAAGRQNSAAVPAAQDLQAALDRYVGALQQDSVQLTDEQAGKARVAEDLTDREVGVLNDYAGQVTAPKDRPGRSDSAATNIGLDKITLDVDRSSIRLAGDASARSMSMDVLRRDEEAKAAEADSATSQLDLTAADTKLTDAQARSSKLEAAAESAFIVSSPSSQDITVSTTDARRFYSFLAAVGVLVVFGLLAYAAIRSPQAAAAAAARA